MPGGEIDTTALIISICVIVPALIAISVCAIIYFSYRKKDRKLHRQTNRSSSYEYEQRRERLPQNTYIIDFSRVHNSQQQRRPRGPPPVFEQSPPSYDTSIIQTGRQSIPLFSPIRTTPSTTTIHRSSPIITPSIYSAMPPSYAEIFLKRHTLPNG
ncbi:unnamed protein product [Rotaria sp. Silwood1]|nr:unnamed protein product [Rotaria sp. Silwood1]CAF4558493.1 unnamed protein product [Rotaria sp. Silwood1]CAF4562663.1 unnamed protein product [Rotaria sp. Silwood1]